MLTGDYNAPNQVDKPGVRIALEIQVDLDKTAWASRLAIDIDSLITDRQRLKRKLAALGLWLALTRVPRAKCIRELCDGEDSLWNTIGGNHPVSTLLIIVMPSWRPNSGRQASAPSCAAWG